MVVSCIVLTLGGVIAAVLLFNKVISHDNDYYYYDDDDDDGDDGCQALRDYDMRGAPLSTMATH